MRSEACRGEGGVAESMCGAVVPAAMGVAAAQPGREGLPENPGGESSPMDFLGLSDSTQLARIDPTPRDWLTQPIKNIGGDVSKTQPTD